MIANAPALDRSRCIRPDETPLPAVQVAERQSKTRRKEEMTALQALGEALLRVGPARRAELASAGAPERGARCGTADHATRGQAAAAAVHRPADARGRCRAHPGPFGAVGRCPQRGKGAPACGRAVADAALVRSRRAGGALRRAARCGPDAARGAGRERARGARPRPAAARVSRAVSRPRRASSLGRMMASRVPAVADCAGRTTMNDRATADDRSGLDQRSRLGRRVRGQGHSRTRGMVHRGAAHALAHGDPTHCRRASATSSTR